MHCEEWCFDTADTHFPVLSGFGNVHTLLTLSMCAFSIIALFGRQYSNTPSTRTMICSRAFICYTFVCVTLSVLGQFLKNSIFWKGFATIHDKNIRSLTTGAGCFVSFLEMFHLFVVFENRVLWATNTIAYPLAALTRAGTDTL